MSDVERTRGLMATDDPMVWATEFCRIFRGHTIIDETYKAEGGGVPGRHVDEGTMVGWFANAMQVAIDMDRARRARISAATEHIPQSEKDAFVAGFTDGREPEDDDSVT